jgi:protein SCO1/2
MLYNYKLLLKLFAVYLAAGMLAFNAGAEQAGHENHDHEHHAADGDDDPHAHHKAMMNKPAERAKTTEVDLLDLVLMDQNGDEMKFVSDVIGDRIVVMDFIYTSCTTVCPVISAVFGQVQDKLGDQLGDEVVLVSVSVDPVRDTPQRLKAYAANHKAQPGWIWLTGDKRTLEKVLDGLGAYTPNFENHPAMVLVGDGQTGKWSRFFGFPNPDRLMNQVSVLQVARTVAAGG